MRQVSQYFGAGSTIYFQQQAMKMTQLGNKAFSDWTLYAFLRQPDLMIGDILTDSILNNWGIDANGNVERLDRLPESERIPLSKYIRFNSDGILEVDSEISINLKSQIKELITLATAETYGQLPEGEFMGIQLNFLTNLTTMFVGWLPALFIKRFGRASYDANSKNVKIGRYRAAFLFLASRDTARTGIGNMILAIIDNAGMLLKYAFFAEAGIKREDYLKLEFIKWATSFPSRAKQLGKTEEEQFNAWKDGLHRSLRSASVELYVILVASLILAGAKGDYDDDEKADYKQHRFGRFMVRTLGKAHKEMLGLLDPTEYARFLQEPLPIAGMLRDLINVFTNTNDEFLDWITNNTDKRDKTPWGYYSSYFIPGFRQFRRIVEPYEQDKEVGLQD